MPCNYIKTIPEIQQTYMCDPAKWLSVGVWINKKWKRYRVSMQDQLEHLHREYIKLILFKPH